MKSGMMERDMNKSDSPDAIKKNKLDVDAYLVRIFVIFSIFVLFSSIDSSFPVGILFQTPRS